ncbi:MAG: hypothetical protein LBG80_17245, partial [Bacteroidales bacterium]|nr:hypothetical protein [Bacteroidales bacterium]
MSILIDRKVKDKNVVSLGKKEIFALSKVKQTMTTTDMMRLTKINLLLRRIISFSFCMIVFSGLGIAQSVSGLTAVNDILRTGPLQLIRKDIIKNDTIPRDNYEWKIISPSLPASVGTLTKEGNYLIFEPAINCRDTAFTILYELSASNAKDTADVNIIVSPYNKPVNIIEADVKCYENMPANITFGVQRKFPTYSNATTYKPPSGWIDGYTSPLVGDLTGDGKPEIVIAGSNNADNWSGNLFTVHTINIYNGQTGDLMHKYDITNNAGLYWSAFTIGDAYHRPPSIFALADLDNDGLGEIVICNVENGKIAALKPVVSNYQITNLTVMWRGTDNSGAVMSYKAPLTSTSRLEYGYPNPYIADIDADGTPEVIVYNKIFDGATGRLVMSWQNEAISTQSSDITNTTTGLRTDRFYADPVSSANATNIRGSAMAGMRRANGADYADEYMPVPAIIDIDEDGKLEIITGNRIHKFNISDKINHINNTYTTIEGPQSVTVPEGSNNTSITYYLSDGFTRVADIDGDGKLDIIVACNGNNGIADSKIIVYVWEWDNTSAVKACVSFRGDVLWGNFSIPFVGDINGKLDGWNGSDYTKKLPEICILTGLVYINRAEKILDIPGHTGIMFHPLSNESLRRGANNTISSSDESPGWNNNNTSSNYRRFNRTVQFNGVWGGHIIGLTWDDQATAVEEKLKLSWAMEHRDQSNNTGITLFDFDNNNTADLCYRDENTLRVISPGKSGKDYVEYTEDENSPNSSVMFRTTVYNGTAFEYPVIADVNMDGSADIVVTNTGNTSNQYPGGWVEVYEHSGQKWAPCPPVWNQGMYDPTMVREDLKINASPIPMLTPYTKNNETIYPYNGSWIQVPIVRDEQDFVPVVRQPDAVLQDVRVKVIDATTTEVTVEIFNNGTATLAANTPISFYNGGTGGFSIGSSAFIQVEELGIDVFPEAKVTQIYTLSGDNYNNCLIWGRVMANDSEFPASGFDDCELSNNTFSGIDCPYLKYTVEASSTVICSNSGIVKLEAVAGEAPHFQPVYQWYKDGMIIQNATNSIYFATTAGEYKCYVTENVCRGYSSSVTITRDKDLNYATPDLVTLPANGKLCVKANVVLKVNNFTEYTGGTYIWIKDSVPFDTTSSYYINIPHPNIPAGQEAGAYQVFVTIGACNALSEKDSIHISTDEAVEPLITKTPTDAIICGNNGSVRLQIENLSNMTGSVFQWYKDAVLIPDATDFCYFATEAGTYSVNVTSVNGCSTFSNDIDLSKDVNNNIIRPIISRDPASGDLCAGGSALLRITNVVSGYTYFWYKAGESEPVGSGDYTYVTSAGRYYALAIDEHCTSNSTEIDILASATTIITPEIESSSGGLNVNRGNSIQLQLKTPISGATGYQWYKDGVAIVGVTNDTLTVTEAGYYSLKVTTADCYAFSDGLTVTSSG